MPCSQISASGLPMLGCTRCQRALPLTSRSPSILASRCHAPCSGQQPTTGEEGSQRRHCVLDMCVPAAGSAGPTRASGRGGRQRRRQCIDVHKGGVFRQPPACPVQPASLAALSGCMHNTARSNTCWGGACSLKAAAAQAPSSFAAGRSPFIPRHKRWRTCCSGAQLKLRQPTA